MQIREERAELMSYSSNAMICSVVEAMMIHAKMEG